MPVSGRRPLKVLAADDDPVSLRLLEASLRRWGYEVVTASDGHAAWRAMLEDLDITVAVLDWNMPGADGIELCRLAREAFAERTLYMILLTARHGTASMLEGFEAGADDYVTKPFRAEELRARVNVGFRVTGLQHTLADRITDLQAAERRYRELVDDLDVVVWEAELEPWRYRFVSRQAAELVGGDPARFLDNDTWLSHVVPADRKVVEAFRRELVDGAAHAGCEYRLMGSDGSTLTVRDQARQAVSELRGPRRVRGVTIDVTLRRQAREQLEAAIKMQADFVSFASHQLRTPLTGIQWMLELALGEEDRTAMGEYVAESVEASKRLIALVNDLLRISRLEGGRLDMTPERCDAAALAREVVADVMPVARKHEHEVACVGLEQEAPVVADVQLLRQVIQNLAANAIKYTLPGGCIRIEVGQHGPEIWCQVSDNGIGVPEAARGRLFEKFFRADNVSRVETEGTGLGLYMVRLIVERFHGRIWYEPVASGGSRFVVALPLATASVEARPTEAVSP